MDCGPSGVAQEPATAHPGARRRQPTAGPGRRAGGPGGPSTQHGPASRRWASSITPGWLPPGVPAVGATPRISGRPSRGLLQLLYCKFTEYLEDFHVWTSVYSRPSPSGFLPTARLTVAFALLCAYACLTALVTAAGQEQVGGATFSGSGFRLPDSRCDSCSAQGSAGSQSSEEGLSGVGGRGEAVIRAPRGDARPLAWVQAGCSLGGGPPPRPPQRTARPPEPPRGAAAWASQSVLLGCL